jgi:triosephosphate isomerase (TIM)
MIVPLVVGNWKMHGNQSECVSLARAIVRLKRRCPARVQLAVSPPFTALASVTKTLRSSPIGVAAQNCHWQERGAFTGEVSPTMLRGVGCDMVILGHSERRHIFHETDAIVAQKLVAALRNGLRVILCVGETLTERRQGRTVKVITRQLQIALKGIAKNGIDNIEIAYEPVWAIGTGQNASPAQIAEVHRRIRQVLTARFGKAAGSRSRILYGGSVKPDNAAPLAMTAEVGGFLVGGASLAAESFISIARCFNRKLN